MMTPEEYCDRLVRVSGGRLALVFPDSIVDPKIGEPFASQYQAWVLATLRAVAPQTTIIPQLPGLDIHDGLRIRLAYNLDDRTIRAEYNTESGVRSSTIRSEVEDYVTQLKRKLGYAEAWLIQYRRQ